MDKSTAKLTQPMPQSTRMFASALAFLGGGLDVYCHYFFKTLVATQTGNFILLSTNLMHHAWTTSLVQIDSIMCFSVGFILGNYWKSKAQSAYWRTYHFLPLLMVTLVVPLIKVRLIQVGLLAFAVGLLVLTFSGSHMLKTPYMVMMTSGNYRKLLNAIYCWCTATDATARLAARHHVINYLLLVGGFIMGIVVSIIACDMWQMAALWLYSGIILGMIIYYTSVVYVRGLQQINR